MALSSKLGSTAQPGTNTTVQVTGLGFQPEVILFFWNLATADGGHADSAVGIGVWCRNGGTPTQHACWHVADDANTDTAGNNRGTASDCILRTSAAGTVLGLADVSASDSDSFTLNYTSVDGTAYVTNYIALGGDIRGKSGAEAKPTTTGNEVITGATDGSTTPTALLIITGGDDMLALNTNYSARASIGLGWGTSATSRGGSWWGQRSGRTTGDGVVYQRTAIIAASTSNGVLGEADLVTLDSDGFTLNWTTVSTRASYYFWIALWGTGISVNVGAFNSDTDLGAQAVSGVGFQPEVLLMQSFGKAAAATVQTENRYALGAARSTTERAVIWAGGDWAAATTDESSLLDRDKVMLFATMGGASPTKDAEADLTSFDADGFTLDWTDASPGAYQMLYCAIRGATGGGGGGATHPGRFDGWW